jgi:hypothetical protein
MAKLISIYWRDIPAQVIGRVGRDNFKRELPPRFAKAIDKAAMRAGRGTSQAYLDDWRRESEEVSGDVERLVLERVALLESRFPQERLDKVVHAGGLAAGIETRGEALPTEPLSETESGVGTGSAADDKGGAAG